MDSKPYSLSPLYPKGPCRVIPYNFLPNAPQPLSSEDPIVLGLGFRAWGLGFRVLGLWVWGLELRILHLQI